MKPTTFIRQFEESYKKGTYVPYSYTRTMDLYVPKNIKVHEQVSSVK